MIQTAIGACIDAEGVVLGCGYPIFNDIYAIFVREWPVGGMFQSFRSQARWRNPA